MICHLFINSWLDVPHFWDHHRGCRSRIDLKPTLVEAQSPSGFGKVPYTMPGPPILTNTGDIRKNDYKNMILEIESTILFEVTRIFLKDVIDGLPLWMALICRTGPAGWIFSSRLGTPG